MKPSGATELKTDFTTESAIERCEHWKELPMELRYEAPSASEVESIRQGAAVVSLQPGQRLQVAQSYFKMGLAGSLETTSTRAAVNERLERALGLLPAEYGLIVFDAFRTIECQRALLHWMAQDVQRRHPELNPSQSLKIAKEFVADPDDPSRPTVPTHNSGGAIDLALTYQGQVLDFGTDFDEPSPLSAALALEAPYQPDSGISESRWLSGRKNRRLLFHLMKTLGFTCLPSEWWHYDLGDFLWSRATGVPWIFESMESAALRG